MAITIWRAVSVCPLTCTAQGEISDHVETAAKAYGRISCLIIAKGAKSGWVSFDEGLENAGPFVPPTGDKAPGIGAMRETFFLNMLGVNHSVSVPVKGDFLVNDEITFEVGGKNKDSSQIQNTENAWLALDNIEIGHGIRIPLWLFGYLY